MSTVGQVTEEGFIKRFRQYQNARDVYYVVVLEDVSRQKIVAAASLVVEKKIVHDLGLVYLFQMSHNLS